MATIPSVIAAMIEAAERPAPPRGARPAKPVVTLSRDHFSGGDVIAQRLAQRLDVALYDSEILALVAARLGADAATLKALDESQHRGHDTWLYSALTGTDLSAATYRDNLEKVVRGLAHGGGVIVGRGAHVVLATSCVLRVRIAGSPDACARRMAKSQGVAVPEAKADIERINHNRGKFVWDLFASRLGDAHAFDITVNTDRMDDFEDVVDMLDLMAQRVHTGDAVWREGR